MEGDYHGIPLRFIDTPGLVPSADSVGHNERVLNQVCTVASRFALWLSIPARRLCFVCLLT